VRLNLLLSLRSPLKSDPGLKGAFFIASRQVSYYIRATHMAIFRELTLLEASPSPSTDPASAQGVSSPLARPLSPSRAAQIPHQPKPDWLRIRPPAGSSYLKIKDLLAARNLHTVCQEAHCPNVAECWASGTATFMLGGDICTRACRFCAIQTARRPPPLDPKEPEHIAESIATLGLHYVVLTSVDRDDLPDQGSGHFAQTIEAIKRRDPEIAVEALVPDFRGDEAAVDRIVRSRLDVYAHNVETVARLQYRVRDPRAGYEQSLQTLRVAKRLAQDSGQPLFTKSALMVGLGETESELEACFEDLRAYDVDILTIGQYLRPSIQHLPVEKYYTPEAFESLGQLARSKGFLYVASGPMVRSSYRAGELLIQGLIQQRKGTHGI
jgi:lipoic acid synthetase